MFYGTCNTQFRFKKDGAAVETSVETSVGSSVGSLVETLVGSSVETLVGMLVLSFSIFKHSVLLNVLIVHGSLYQNSVAS